MLEPAWLLQPVVLAIHDAQLAEHGGRAGLRDAGLLESALARPRNLFLHEAPDIAALAARYAYGLSRNHPSVDGSKRVSLVCAELFLALNGYELLADDAATFTIWLELAEGMLDEAALAGWLRGHIGPLAA
jgi:death-on-curing protein